MCMTSCHLADRLQGGMWILTTAVCSLVLSGTASLSGTILELFLDKSVTDEELWSRAISKIYLEPQGISKDAYFSLEKTTVAAIVATNPSLSTVPFVVQIPGRPYMVLGTTMVGPQGVLLDPKNHSWASQEGTPLYFGQPHLQNVTYGTSYTNTLSRMPLYCKIGVIVGVSVAKPRVPWVHAGCVRVRGHACTPYCSHAHSTCAQFQLPPVKSGQGQVDQPFHWWLHRIMGNGQHAHALGDPCGVWEHGRDHGISHAIPPARVDRNVQLCFWRGNLVGASC